MPAQRYKVSRNTAAKALASPVPTGRKKPPPRKSVLEPVKGFRPQPQCAARDGWRSQVHILGPRGAPTGPDRCKSHLLIGVSTAIAAAGMSVRYITTSAPVNELAEADAARRLSSVIARYSKVGLLRLDEFGYLNLDKKCARLLFKIFTEREECKATAVATNSPFAEWDRIFADPRLCAAIADRITFRCTLIQTGTESYRYQATEADRQAKSAR
ncbi:ATP-binding protein [Streptomyces sp. NPDC060035]|uniref:ATP-binding protein n=1 Tax=Streptomyces sp. NPDC060035 TaxID=3347044 RepID=UPI00369C8903